MFSLNLDATVDFLMNLIEKPSPTGYYAEAIEYVAASFDALEVPGMDIQTTPKGALVVTLEGRNRHQPRGVTAHIDTLGLMVREIKSNGRLKTSPLGGIMWGGIEMEGVTVRTHDDQRYRGTVVPTKP